MNSDSDFTMMDSSVRKRRRPHTFYRVFDLVSLNVRERRHCHRRCTPSLSTFYLPFCIESLHSMSLLVETENLLNWTSVRT